MTVFEKPGRENTKTAFELAFAAAREKGIKNIVFATSTGFTPTMLPDDREGLNVVCVGEVYGAVDAGVNPMSEEDMDKIRSMGVKLVICPHAFTATGTKNGLSAPPAVMANTLRMFSQGTKVCVEIGAMAVDCGAVPYMEPAVCLGGTGVGLDTAMILRPSHCASILDTKIDEMLCKPFVE